MKVLLANEDFEAEHKAHSMYLSNSRSERTGGHMWTERVAEVSYGKIRYLIADDGKPLSPDRAAAERARMAQIAADPEEFRRQQQALKNDETHARQMLHLVNDAFILEGPRMEGPWWRIDFKPDPNYQPKSLEERFLRAMTGYMLLQPSPKPVRLHYIEGRLPIDLNIGFGFLATVKAGSNFSTRRELVNGGEWKTVLLDTNIDGKAIFFKTLARKDHEEHSEFEPLGPEIRVQEAVDLLEKQ